MALTRVSGNLLTSTAVTAGIYGGSGNTVSLTVDAQGRVTAAANVASSGGGITYTTVKTANYTAVADDGVQTNTTAGAFTVTLPATPANGDQVFVVDSFNTWGTNNLTIGRNGSTIEGVAQDLVCDITGVSVQCVYNGTTWDIYAQVGGAGGSVVSGAASSTDNAIARFDSTTGKIIQNSVVTIADTTGNMAGVGTLSLATTLGVGGATPSASGSGITFPATQSASSDANTLDEYEEGSFTATLTGCTTAPTCTVYYTRVGNVCTLDFLGVGLAATSNTTACTVTGVPSAAQVGSPKHIGSPAIYNAGSQSYGDAYLSGGTISLGWDVQGSAFTASGTKGLIYGFVATYIIL